MQTKLKVNLEKVKVNLEKVKVMTQTSESAGRWD